MDQYNKVCNPIVSDYSLTKDENGRLVDSTSYKQMVESLMYLLATRPDLAYSVCLIDRYMDIPTKIHLTTAKRILSYLRGTENLGILYKMNDELVFQGWLDSDYVGDNEDRKITTRYVFKLGSSHISWSLKKQLIVTLSSTKVEFVAAKSNACKAMWLRSIFHKLGET